MIIILILLGVFMLFSLLWSIESMEWLVGKISPSTPPYMRSGWGEFITGLALLTVVLLFVFDQWGEEPWSNLWWFMTRYGLFVIILKILMWFDKK